MADARRKVSLLCGDFYARGEEGSDEAVARLASRQQGVVSRSQLGALGLGKTSIDLRLASGRLRRFHRGIFAVGHDAVSFRGRAIAALLSLPRGAAVSHLTAAALWRITDPPAGAIHITATQPRASRAGVVIHRARRLDEDTEIAAEIPVTTVERTLLDLSAVVSERQLRRLVKRAEFERLTDLAALAEILERYPRRRGRRTLARIVGGRASGAGRTNSELEDRFLEFCARRGLPLPQTNVPVRLRGNRFEVDCLWRDARLVAELDSRRAHDTHSAFEDDRARDRVLLSEGWAVMRLTWAQLHGEPDTLEREIRDTLARRLPDARRNLPAGEGDFYARAARVRGASRGVA